LAVVVAHRHGAGSWPELQVIGARSRQVHRSQGKRIPPLRVSGIAGKKALAQADAAQPQTVFPLRGNKLAVAQGYFSIAIQAGVPSRGSGIPATTTGPRLPARLRSLVPRQLEPAQQARRMPRDEAAQTCMAAQLHAV